MTHYCPSCGRFSWHDERQGARSWALICPHCSHEARQHPHPPAQRARSTRKRRTTAAGTAEVDVGPDEAGAAEGSA